jgi:SAM-dependent methyltransferase
MPRDLLIGCGSNHERRIHANGRTQWGELVTLDNVDSHKPDVLHDLRNPRLPFDDNSFDEIHAYEVLEHIGQQGDASLLFAQFSDYWRVLKPGGLFCATCPSWNSIWAWGDPSHTRIISPGTIVFLDQAEYTKQIGKTPMSDFRHIYRADFEALAAQDENESFRFVLRAVKPSRISI